MSNFTVVVIAMPQVAEALAGTGQFSAVEAAGSTGGLRDLLRSGRMGPGAADKIFIFSDVTPVDTPQGLDYLIQQMTGMKARVLIVATTPAGEELVRAVPSAGLVKGALRLNTILGAIGGMAVPVRPVPVEANVELDSSPMAGPLAAPAAPPAASPFGAAPAQPAAPVAEPANPFGGAPAQPAQPAEPANPFGGAPAQPAAPASAAANPFGAAPAQPAAESNPFGAPAAPAAEQANPFGAPPAQAPAAEQANPFGAPAAQPAADANPFGAPPVQPAAPAAAEPGNPFGAPPAQPAAGNPFGAPPAQPAAGNPFGAPPVAAEQSSPFGAPPAQTGLAQSPFGSAARPVMRAGTEEVAAAPQRRGYVITITSPKGGTGKSSLSLNLAAYLGLRTQGQRTVALIDANVQQADAGKYLNAWTPNIEELGKDPSAIHPDRITDHLLHKHDLNLSVLLGPMTPDAAHPVFYTGKKYSQILEAMRPNYDYIIIDTPVAEFYHDMFRDFALPVADFLLVTIAPNYTTLMNTDAWLRQVCAPKQSGGAGVDPAKVGVVLNRAEEEIGFSEVEVMRDLNEWRYLGAIPETKEWKLCNNEGRLVATMNYGELNEAFSNILYQATGDELLRTGPVNLASESTGIAAKLKGLLGSKAKGKSRKG